MPLGYSYHTCENTNLTIVRTQYDTLQYTTCTHSIGKITHRTHQSSLLKITLLRGASPAVRSTSPADLPLPVGIRQHNNLARTRNLHHRATHHTQRLYHCIFTSTALNYAHICNKTHELLVAVHTHTTNCIYERTPVVVNYSTTVHP